MKAVQPTKAEIAAKFAAGFHCANCSLCPWADALGYDEEELLRMSSAFGGGMFHGETCGAVTGAILAISALNGREFDAIGEMAARNKTFALCYRFIDRFKAEYGSIQCAGIQEKLYGRKYDMTNLADFQAFLADGGHDPQGCPTVVGTAAKLAAEVLEEDAANPQEEYAMFR